MARLAATAKGYFYPTQPHTLSILSTLARPQDKGVHVLLDPCCGEGHALRTLAKAWGCRAYGNELETGRYQAAARLIRTVTCGDLTRLQFSAGAAGAILYNPPFAYEGAAKERLEILYLPYLFNWLCPDGLLVAILPEHVARLEKLRLLLTCQYHNIHVRRYPADEYGQFKQVVIFAQRSREISPESIYHADYMLKEFEPLAELASGEFSFPIPPTCLPPLFEVAAHSPEQMIALALKGGVSQSESWRRLVAPEREALALRPAEKPRPGHGALLVAAGWADGAQVPTSEGCLVIKGRTIKWIQEISRSQGKDENGRKRPNRVTRTERLAACLDTFNRHTAEFASYDSRQPESYNAFVQAHAAAMAALLEQRYPPRFSEADLPRYEPLLARLHSPGKLPGLEALDGLLPAQARKAAAIDTLWRSGKSAILSGERGTGKTTIATAAVYLHAARRLEAGRPAKVVVLCPGHLARKWARETRAILRGLGGQARICAGINDIDRAMAEPGLTLLIVSKERAKLGGRWGHAIPRARRQIRYTVPERRYEMQGWGAVPVTAEVEHKEIREVGLCPHCGQHLRLPQERYERKLRCGRCRSPLWTALPLPPGSTHPERQPLAAYTRQNGDGRLEPLYVFERRAEALAWVRHNLSQLGLPNPCLTPYLRLLYGLLTLEWLIRQPQALAELWREALFALHLPRGTPRYPLADYIARRYAGRYFLLLDEVHHFKGTDTDQSYAATALASRARKVLGMTGTLYGGRASSLFQILFRTDPDFRRRFRHTDVARFINRYGLQEEVLEETEIETARHSRSAGNRRWRGKRRREIPGCTPAIVSLLLPYTVFLSLKELGYELPPYEEQVKLVRMDPAQAREYGRIMGQMRDDAIREMHGGDMSLLSTWLQASLGWLDAPENDELSYARALPTPAEGWPKDQALLELALEARAQGRQVLAYFSQVDKRDGRGRVKAFLEAHGLKVAILDAGVPLNLREVYADHYGGLDIVERHGGDPDGMSQQGWLKKLRHIQQHEPRGVDVLITNPRLVETGLDLLPFVEIVYCGIEYSLYTLRQSMGRSWRLGQDRPVRVTFLGYADTMQHDALRLLGAKLRGASILDGEIADGLALFEAQDDFVSELMRRILEGDLLPQASEAATATIAQAAAAFGGSNGPTPTLKFEEPPAPSYMGLYGGGPPIAVYDREQALADGYLVDVSEMAAELGIHWPVAVSSALWHDYIVPDEASREEWGQDERGRLWDVLYLYSELARSVKDSFLSYQVYFRVQGELKLVTLHAVCEPCSASNPRPAITITLPEDD